MSLGNDGGIPAVMNVTPTGTISSGSGGMGWGNDGSWWIIILFLFIFAGGWNRNGWGGNGNGATPSGSGAIDNYVLASDFAQVMASTLPPSRSMVCRIPCVKASMGSIPPS